jgi:hypothetical protein
MKTVHGNLPHRRGMTFIELVLGMLVTSMIAAGAASISLAVAKGWRTTETLTSNDLVKLRATWQLQKLLEESKLVGIWRAGSLSASGTPAYVMLWKGDDNLDGKIQLAEIALVEHDSTKQKIFLYQAVFPTSFTPAQKTAANTTLADDCIYADTAASDFKAMTYVTASVLAGKVNDADTKATVAPVTGMVLRNLDSVDTTRPTIEFTVAYGASSGTSVEYGSATLRSPALIPTTKRDQRQTK